MLEWRAQTPCARIGERVWVWNARWNRAFGTAAAFVTLPAAQAVPLPDNTDFAAGACLGIPALTAWQAVETDGGVQAGDWVLVNGGAGAVGHYAVQMATAKGARVIATVSSAEKAAHARDAGAECLVMATDNIQVALVLKKIKELGLNIKVASDNGAGGTGGTNMVGLAGDAADGFVEFF